MSDKSLISLDGAGDVIVKLLDLLEKSVGWVFTPHGRKQDLEEGLAIYKKSIEEDSSLSGAQKGVLIYRARKDFKEYANCSNIISFAASRLKNNAKLNVDEDWLTYFFDYAKNISDNAVQQMWGRILAEQLNGDTSIHRHLIHILSLMDYKTADAFANLCSLTINYPERNVKVSMGSRAFPSNIPFVIGRAFAGLYCAYPENTPQHDWGASYLSHIPSPDELSSLQEIGLIEYSETEGACYSFPYSAGLVEQDYSGINNSYVKTHVRNFVIKYDGKSYLIKPNNDSAVLMGKTFSDKDKVISLPEKLMTGLIKFTTVGDKLYQLIDHHPIDGLIPMYKLWLESQNLVIEETEI